MKKLFLIIAMVVAAVSANAQRTPVKVGDLQKPIIDNVTKDYAGFTIKEATKIVTNNVTTYEVEIAKGTTQQTLLYDKDGKFVKKIGAKEGLVEKQKTTPPAQKQPPVNTQKKK
jgi:hypothetical protein